MPHPDHTRHRGTLDTFLAADDILALPTLPAEEWNTLRKKTGRAIAWEFCTLRNLLVHRGAFAKDAFGFAWGGVYRTLLVGPIVATSYRNEGHFRAGHRISGTSDFFRGSFLLPAGSSQFREIVRLVNLRHHVAGVAMPVEDGGYRVIDGYEADYAYVATAFVESIRRGLEMNGVPAESRRGRQLGEAMCTILYQAAGSTGLRRIPRNLDAHNRFRDAYDQHLRDHPVSPRLRRMAQEIAVRIMPVTTALSGVGVAEHVARHLDDETRQFLFPEGPDPAIEEQRQRVMATGRQDSSVEALKDRSTARAAVWARPDVAALDQAYQDAAHDSTDDRLLGAILLHLVDEGQVNGTPLEQRELVLEAGGSLIEQGHTPREMYVVLSSEKPLTVVRQTDEQEGPQELATLSAPTILGEIGMWRGQPAIASVISREPNRLRLLVIDQARFDVLREESGFRAAAAAEVQRRLSLNAAHVGSLLADTAADTADTRLQSISQLFQFLTGNSHIQLDKVIDLDEDATPIECVEALRQQVSEVLATHELPADLARTLQQIVLTLG